MRVPQASTRASVSVRGGTGEKWADLPEDHEHFVVDPRLASLASLLGEDGESERS